MPTSDQMESEVCHRNHTPAATHNDSRS
ncbi:hypothetical protein OF001_U440006 [Pseudomonas sp. OF001]|nr:hypothetical protein OF001_U440006 [Pseudomonas sp. OF001]